MDKFIILYDKGLYGAIIGTETGTVFSISKEQLQNEAWLNEHTSNVLSVYKLTDQKKASVSNNEFHFLPHDLMGGLEEEIKMKRIIINTDHFQVMFEGFFSNNKMIWIIDDRPFIQPL